MQRIVLFAIVCALIMAAARARVLAEQAAPAAGITTTAGAVDLEGGVPTQFIFGLSEAGLDANGNVFRYRHYVTPPEHLFIGLLALRFLAPENGTAGEIVAENLGEKSARWDGWLVADGGSALVRASQRDSTFFRDWTLGAEPLTRRDLQYDLAMRGESSELMASYDRVKLAGQPGTDPEDWMRSVDSISFTNYFGQWRTRLGYDDENFDFNVGPQFSGDTRVLQLRLSPPMSSRTSLEASAALFQTSLEGVTPSPRSFRVALEGSHDMNDDLTISGELFHNEITDTITQNAYAVRDSNGSMSAEYRGLPRTIVEVGGGIRQVDFINREQTASIAADENTLYARTSSRLTKRLKLKTSFLRTWTNDRPPATELDGGLTGSLVWSSRDDQRVEVAFSPTYRTGVTAGYRRLVWRNRDFDARNSILEHDVFGWWMPTDTITLYGSYLRQDVGLSGVDVNPDQYVTDNETSVIGASIQLTRSLLFDIAFADTNSRGALGVAQNVLSLGMTHELPSGDRLSVRASLDDFDTSEQAPLLNYTADWIEVRFEKAAF